MSDTLNKLSEENYCRNLGITIASNYPDELRAISVGLAIADDWDEIHLIRAGIYEQLKRVKKGKSKS